MRPIESTLARALRQVVGLDDLIERERLHVELLVGERLQAVGPRQMRVFGAQQVDRVALLVDQVARFDDLLGGVNRLVFDAE